MAAEVKDLRGMLQFRNGASISSTVNPEQTSQKKTFTLVDYNWTQDMDNLDEEFILPEAKKAVPKLILTEFQPQKSYTFDKPIQKAGKLLGKGLNAVKQSGGLLGAVAGFAVDTASTFNQRRVFNNFADPENFEQVVGRGSMKWTKQLMQGQYLGSFEIPFFSEDYLIADSTDAWQEGNSEEALGDEGSKAIQENFSLNFPMSPIWKKTSAEKKIDWSNVFYLINNNEDNLQRNFAFLHALTSGCLWVQLGSLQQSPNVYDVVCPGRFHQYYTTISITVEFQGKVRKVNSGKMSSFLQQKNIMLLEDHMMFPDAYKISMKCKDLTPVNFNTHMDYLAGTWEQITVGKETNRVGSIPSVLGLGSSPETAEPPKTAKELVLNNPIPNNSTPGKITTSSKWQIGIARSNK